MTVGDGPSADAGVEGKAPGVVFTLELGDVWVLLVVAMVRNGVTLASSYTLCNFLGLFNSALG